MSKIAHRSEAKVAAVLPRAVQIRRGREHRHSVDLKLNGEPIQVHWLGEGGLRQARELIADQKNHPDVVAARRMSPGAREALSAAGVGWVDETGAAEIALRSLIVSRSGRPTEASREPPRWTPSVLAIAEALLCGGRATVDAMQIAYFVTAQDHWPLSLGGSVLVVPDRQQRGDVFHLDRVGEQAVRTNPPSAALRDAHSLPTTPNAQLRVGMLADCTPGKTERAGRFALTHSLSATRRAATRLAPN